MSEFYHPPIAAEPPQPKSLEQEFAERAYEILSLYQMDYTTINGDYQLTYPVTDRVDMISSDATRKVALRLKRCPVYAMSRAENPSVKPDERVQAGDASSEYMVIELQYGTVLIEEIDEAEMLIDEDFTWQPYVMTVTSQSGEAHVLDTRTGQPLAAADVWQAAYTMELMRGELRGIVHESSFYVDDMPVVRTSLKTTYQSFPTAEDADFNTYCPHCGQQNTLCNHTDELRNNPWLN